MGEVIHMFGCPAETAVWNRWKVLRLKRFANAALAHDPAHMTAENEARKAFEAVMGEDFLKEAR